MKKIISLIIILFSLVAFSQSLFAQNYPHNPQTKHGQQSSNKNQPNQPVPPPPPPLDSINQSFYTNATKLDLGQLPTFGINISAEANAMAEDSSIEIKRLNIEATANEMMLNCKHKRFVPVSDLFEIKTKGMNQYAALPIKYAIMAKGIVPNGSRLFVLVKPASVTSTYGMVIAEINSCAIYDKIALIADISYNNNYLKSYKLSSSQYADDKTTNPHYATLSNDDGFTISAHIFPEFGRSSDFTSPTMTIIQPKTSYSLDVYKLQDKENVFVQSLPFTLVNSYSFCKVNLNNFERYYDNISLSYGIRIGFENTNIEDIPNALIFRSNCYDADGVCYSTEDQLVYIGIPQDGYASPFSGGNGTSSNPFIITNTNQLDKIRDYKRRYFKLGCDLDIRNYQGRNWLAIGDQEDPFNGLLDGNSRTIHNFTINEPNEKYQGLFGCIKNGTVKNLRIDFSPEGIIADSYCGGLAGYSSNSRVYQCYSTGGIKANNYIGGLIGYCTNNTTVRKSMSDFSDDSNIENITIGGLIGYAENTTITDCHTNTIITASGEKSSIGGIVAQGENLKMQNCYSTGKLKTGKKGYAGGLVGYMKNCETKGCIALNSRIESENQGRLAGKAINSSFIRSYAWEYIRDIDNKYVSEGGFGGDTSNDGKNGESIAKSSFYGSKTRNKFWTINKKVGFNLNSWIFNSGYNLPQLRNMPSLSNPDYLR